MADNLTKEQRSYTMSRIRAKNTAPELLIRRLAHARGLRFRTHVRSLAGTPDLVFVRSKTIVFVDGDFWHGWRFPRWKNALGLYWQQKIQRNRLRDRRNFQKLREQGWAVIRLWEHEVKQDAGDCIDRIHSVIVRRLAEQSKLLCTAGSQPPESTCR